MTAIYETPLYNPIRTLEVSLAARRDVGMVLTEEEAELLLDLSSEIAVHLQSWSENA